MLNFMFQGFRFGNGVQWYSRRQRSGGAQSVSRPHLRAATVTMGVSLPRRAGVVLLLLLVAVPLTWAAKPSKAKVRAAELGKVKRIRLHHDEQGGAASDLQGARLAFDVPDVDADVVSALRVRVDVTGIRGHGATGLEECGVACVLRAVVLRAGVDWDDDLADGAENPADSENGATGNARSTDEARGPGEADAESTELLRDGSRVEARCAGYPKRCEPEELNAVYSRCGDDERRAAFADAKALQSQRCVPRMNGVVTVVDDPSPGRWELRVSLPYSEDGIDVEVAVYPELVALPTAQVSTGDEAELSDVLDDGGVGARMLRPADLEWPEQAVKVTGVMVATPNKAPSGAVYGSLELALAAPLAEFSFEVMVCATHGPTLLLSGMYPHGRCRTVLLNDGTSEWVTGVIGLPHVRHEASQYPEADFLLQLPGRGDLGDVVARVSFEERLSPDRITFFSVVALVFGVMAYLQIRRARRLVTEMPSTEGLTPDKAEVAAKGVLRRMFWGPTVPRAGDDAAFLDRCLGAFVLRWPRLSMAVQITFTLACAAAGAAALLVQFASAETAIGTAAGLCLVLGVALTLTWVYAPKRGHRATAEAPDTRTPVTVITGFLGAGKTTLLNALLEKEREGVDPSGKDRRFLIIENEVGDVGVDNELLVTDTKEEIILMSSGCVCCKVRGDLSRLLREQCDPERVGGYDHIIIETTGVANPSPVVQTLFVDDAVKANLRLDAVVTVVDCVHFQKQITRRAKRPAVPTKKASEQAVTRTVAKAETAWVSAAAAANAGLGPSFDASAGAGRAYRVDDGGAEESKGGEGRPKRRRKPDLPAQEAGPNETVRQVAFADVVLLNKVDLAGKETVAAARRSVVAINPRAKVIECSRGDVALGDVLDIRAFDLERLDALGVTTTDADGGSDGGGGGGAHSHVEASAIETVSVREAGNVDLDILNRWLVDTLQAHGERIYRLKGVFSIAGQSRRHVCHGIHMLFEGSPGRAWQQGEERTCTLVVIGVGVRALALDAAFRLLMRASKQDGARPKTS